MQVCIKNIYICGFFFSLVHHQQKERGAHLTHQDNTKTEALTSTSPRKRVSEDEMLWMGAFS